MASAEIDTHLDQNSDHKLIVIGESMKPHSVMDIQELLIFNWQSYMDVVSTQPENKVLSAGTPFLVDSGGITTSIGLPSVSDLLNSV